MKIKTAELTGAALDWAVATANGDYPQWDAEWEVFYAANGDDMDYSTDWAQGGPIIERERIFLKPSKLSPTTAKRIAWGAHGFYGNTEQKVHRHGPTPLIAAMRCYVASKLGDEVDVPDELCQA